MNYWESPFIEWRKEAPAGWDIYLCQIRPSRNKAIVTAVVEALSLLADFEPMALLSGPLADQRGVYWIGLPPQHRAELQPRLLHLGYTYQVHRVAPLAELAQNEHTENLVSVRWRKELFYLLPVYTEDAEWMRNRAPDKRTFWLKNAAGEIVPLQGYRGDSNEMSRRGLPPEDGRVLVNLARAPGNFHGARNFLDPLAGVGGLLIEAVDQGYIVFSADIDQKVQYGLQRLSKRHVVCDAAKLSFGDNAFWAVAAELPFGLDETKRLNAFTAEFCRVLQPGGRLSLMLVKPQLHVIARKASTLPLTLLMQENINRKGTDVWICVWQKERIGRQSQ